MSYSFKILFLLFLLPVFSASPSLVSWPNFLLSARPRCFTSDWRWDPGDSCVCQLCPPLWVCCFPSKQTHGGGHGGCSTRECPEAIHSLSPLVGTWRGFRGKDAASLVWSVTPSAHAGSSLEPV